MDLEDKEKRDCDKLHSTSVGIGPTYTRPNRRGSKQRVFVSRCKKLCSVVLSQNGYGYIYKYIRHRALARQGVFDPLVLVF